MKSKTFSFFILCYLVTFLVLLTPGTIIGTKAIKSMQISGCTTGSYGYITPYGSVAVEVSEEECLVMVENQDFQRLLMAIIATAVLAGPFTPLAILGLALFDSAFGKTEDFVSEELKKYGREHFVHHLIEASNGDMTKVEVALMDIPDSNENKRHFIDQYIETLPADQRDAAAKRLRSNPEI